MLGPVLAGLGGVLLPATGYFPALGGHTLSTAPLHALTDWPGLWPSARLSLTTGLAATLISLTLSALIGAAWQGTRTFRWLERALSPLLSVPHAAAAFGIAFLIAPSGWIVRMLSPWATGWHTPPDLLIVQDPWGMAMTLGLVAKELPFLMIMMLAALPQAAPQRSLQVAQALGYGRIRGWLITVFPRVYAQIRLPVYAVLAYSMSVVDVAIILGPNTPPPLSVQVVRWMSDPDLSHRFIAAAGALLQLTLVITALVLWRLGERLAASIGLYMAHSGHRRPHDGPWRALILLAGALSALAVLAGLIGLGLWSLAGFWRFPEVLPDALSTRHWQRHGSTLGDPLSETLFIAGGATVLALGLVLACLEAEHRLKLRMGAGGYWLIYTPLLIPQIAFLPGLSALALMLGADMGRLAVIGVHLVFVLPYVFLSLGGPWRSWDHRLASAGAALGASPNRVFWRLRLPMMLAPILTAAAVGFAVSVGQYLPTLLIGAGRIQTLTTEAVALASGGDRRIIGIYACAQTAVVFAGFLLALVVPRLLWNGRRGMQR